MTETMPTFVILGTMGGPIPRFGRSQPANLLLHERGAILIDAGDGVVNQIVKAGLSLAQIRTLMLSHLHFDHTGGLFAVLGLRYQTSAREPLTIWGPPGTRETVSGLLAAMAPMAASGMGDPGRKGDDPAALVVVHEIRGGDRVEVEGIPVTAACNTHYGYLPGTPDYDRHQSLGFRFDLPGRTIVYTGDTGPSRAMEELARDADLLVSEMMDVDATMPAIRRNNPAIPEARLAEIEQHLRSHHLTPHELGQLAAAAGAGTLVVTHQAPGFTDEAHLATYRAAIGDAFTGRAILGEDLGRY
ncbi:MAG: MBL fold metallo-hydrolase [Rhodobacteraceae bacterium]|nr:MBL fold metallo-hydrolase [Paracoccaceae bacterium]